MLGGLVAAAWKLTSRRPRPASVSPICPGSGVHLAHGHWPGWSGEHLRTLAHDVGGARCIKPASASGFGSSAEPNQLDVEPECCIPAFERNHHGEKPNVRRCGAQPHQDHPSVAHRPIGADDVRTPAAAFSSRYMLPRVGAVDRPTGRAASRAGVPDDPLRRRRRAACEPRSIRTRRGARRTSTASRSSVTAPMTPRCARSRHHPPPRALAVALRLCVRVSRSATGHERSTRQIRGLERGRHRRPFPRRRRARTRPPAAAPSAASRRRNFDLASRQDLARRHSQRQPSWTSSASPGPVYASGVPGTAGGSYAVLCHARQRGALPLGASGSAKTDSRGSLPHRRKSATATPAINDADEAYVGALSATIRSQPRATRPRRWAAGDSASPSAGSRARPRRRRRRPRPESWPSWA